MSLNNLIVLLVALVLALLSGCRGGDDNILILAPTSADRAQNGGQRNLDSLTSFDNTEAIVPGTAMFFDSFEYVADRSDSNVGVIFRKQGWNGVKTQQVEPNRHPLGYIYTTDTVLGYESGILPGTNSNRVLAMEALPTTLGHYDGPGTFWGNMQTDFYLEYGQVDGPPGAIPADVWFQFWMYTTPQTLGGKHGPGGFERGMKFLYVCNGSYGCQTESWMVTLGSTSQNPNWVELSSGLGEPVPDIFLQMRGNEAAWSPGHYAGDQFGQTNISEWIVSERWQLVKMHIDTSGPQGSFEAWIRPLGGSEVKVAENIGGVTPGFDWPLTQGSNGHRVLRMPTTVGSRHVVSNFGKLSYDHTIYLDDFTMARSEDDLPEYPY